MTRELLPYDEAIRQLTLLWREADSKLAACLELAREQGFHGGDLHDISYAKQHVGEWPGFQNTDANPDKRYRVLCERLDRDLQHERWLRVVNDGGRGSRADEARDAPLLPGHPHRAWIICPRAHAEQHDFDYLRRRKPYGHALLESRGLLHAGDDQVFAIAPGQ